MSINYEDLIPKGIIFNLQEIQDMKVLKIPKIKKLIYDKELEVVRVGNKLHVPRAELIRYLEENTTKRKKK